MTKDFWERLERLEELAGKATLEKWQRDHLGNVYVAPKGKENDYQAIVCLTKNYDDYVPTEANADFIAAANPAMIQEMAVEIRRLEKENDRLKIELHDMDSSISEMAECIKTHPCPYMSTCTKTHCSSTCGELCNE